MANPRRTQATSARKGARAAASEAPREPASADRIAARAYEIWERRGCPEGTEQENWYQAERELAEARDG